MSDSPWETPILRHRLRMMKAEPDSGEDFGSRVIVETVLAGLVLCKPVPNWVVERFRKLVDPVLKGKVLSWDEALGKPFPKNARESDVSEWLSEVKRVHKVVDRLRLEMRRSKSQGESKRGESVPKEIFQQAGQVLGMGARQVSDMYYDKFILREKPKRVTDPNKRIRDKSGKKRRVVKEAHPTVTKSG